MTWPVETQRLGSSAARSVRSYDVSQKRPLTSESATRASALDRERNDSLHSLRRTKARNDSWWPCWRENNTHTPGSCALLERDHLRVWRTQARSLASRVGSLARLRVRPLYFFEHFYVRRSRAAGETISRGRRRSRTYVRRGQVRDRGRGLWTRDLDQTLPTRKGQPGPLFPKRRRKIDRFYVSEEDSSEPRFLSTLGREDGRGNAGHGPHLEGHCLRRLQIARRRPRARGARPQRHTPASLNRNLVSEYGI